MGLFDAVLAEWADERAEGRSYPGLDLLARCRLTIAPDTGDQAVTSEVLHARAPHPLTRDRYTETRELTEVAHCDQGRHTDALVMWGYAW